MKRDAWFFASPADCCYVYADYIVTDKTICWGFIEDMNYTLISKVIMSKFSK
jgi:hypothetical protein